MSAPSATAYLWKIPLCGFVYALSFVLSAALLSPLAPETLPQPEGEDLWQVLRLLGGGVIMAAGLLVIAGRLQGRWLERCAILFTLLYVANAVNSSIEAYFFTTLADALSFLLLIALAPSLLCAALTVFLVRPPEPGLPLLTSLGQWQRSRRVLAWTWRLPLAVLAFPVIYTVFGLMAFPFVREFYEQQDYLRLPAPATILAVQVSRGALFVIVILPVLAAWSSSRVHLFVALSLTLFFFVGLAGLIQGQLFPLRIALVHGAEIFADSVVHAGVLVLLLGRRSDQ